MARLLGPFSSLKPEKILVIGDLLLDTYTIGKAKRISPEAPVAVIHVQKEESRPGGAGNAILNILSLGSKAIAVGRVGHDFAGKAILELLAQENVDTSGIVIAEDYKTPLKNRIIADNQQVVRVDHECATAITPTEEAKIIALLPELLEGVKVVAISDYGKGFLSTNLLRFLIDEARMRNIMVIADPKGSDFTKYRGVFLIKPNLSEAYAAANLPPETSLDSVAAKVLSEAEADYLMITRSESGISLFAKDSSRQDFPVKAKEVKDVTGAGDTVLAMIAVALASGLPLNEAIPLANVAAGIAIEHIGCARVSLSDLAKRLCDMDNKVFEEKHLDALKFALRDHECISLSLQSDIFSKELILAMHDLKAQSNRSLIISLENEQPQESFVRMLASLYQVDFVILNPTKKALELDCKESFAFQDFALMKL